MNKSFLFILWLLLSVSSFSQRIAGGDIHSLAVCGDGIARSWGSDGNGRLGDNAAIADQTSPVTVATISGITAVAGGGYHSLALQSNGTVWSWGFDGNGQLGDDAATVSKSTPVTVATITNITAIAAGRYFSLALKSDGTVWSWGNDVAGQLGDDAAIANKSTPVQVATLTNITAIATGVAHALARKNDGTVWCWGDNGFCELGLDPACVTPNQSTPVQNPYP